eukprot:TRINITY_DN7249_c0_g1_i1.p1 TRINITY_DN7249_c0_g1~~TRINITY_DN7249_c0_g1_i1.p1  ORF type:complete len:307 (+),score=124.24 TRINITY_DN7249_c0_g1_i1:134-1054(+)
MSLQKNEKGNKLGQGGLERIGEKFGSGVDLYVEEMKTHEAGLSTNADFKKQRYKAILEASQLASNPLYFRKNSSKHFKSTKDISKDITKTELVKKREVSTLSFLDEEEVIPVAKKKKLGKDPLAETSFLHDEEREKALEGEKLKLIEQFMEEQERVQNEICEFTFAYSEYPNAKRSVRVKKSTDIGTVINKCKAILAKDFKNLETMPCEGLMFTKETLILPKECTIYDLIVDKVKGSTGDLLFDLARQKEKIKKKDGTEVEVDIYVDRAAVARITERAKYEKNKNYFPYRSWKEYTPYYTENNPQP